MSEILLKIMVIWSLAVITPGPNFILTMSLATAGQKKKAFLAILGIIIATLFWFLACFIGMHQVFLNYPIFYLCIQLLGGFYLLYLGLKNIFGQQKGQMQYDEVENKTKNIFLQGFTINITNPKTLIFITSIFAGINISHFNYIFIVLVLLSVVMISGIWYSFVVILLSQARFIQLYSQYVHSINKIVGLIFSLFGLNILISILP
ncbi:hypothetical protein B9T31_10005 [Acinetobacter sp. ANC 4558]|uniref:LysE family translocator n=1 Tax=Acinetobacter sp. ANC 4558 TaxID=1977876 RepID=UPI000A32D7CB|nr:LysE family transporter [Acinetobacter sp. ANC 4558]OTG85913.1 hypothetical protein B9T31_10005 [Acinetobacter sp. ANC 4558]